MKKRYIFLALVPIVLSVLLALLPDKSNSIDAKRLAKNLKSAKYTGVSPDKLLLESVNDDRFMQPDELATVIMGQDPSYMLIDLRDAGQFGKFTLPGAINIPSDQILTDENRATFESDAYKYVLISNGTVLSDQVWMILRRAGYDNLKVLNGGLNQFYQLYLNPPKPGELDPSEAFENYRFRKAVGAHLGLPNPDEFIPGGSAAVASPTTTTNTTQAVTKTPTKTVVPKKAAGGGDEGC
jgi:rhodanese-related sulfurtransferase